MMVDRLVIVGVMFLNLLGGYFVGQYSSTADRKACAQRLQETAADLTSCELARAPSRSQPVRRPEPFVGPVHIQEPEIRCYQHDGAKCCFRIWVDATWGHATHEPLDCVANGG